MFKTFPAFEKTRKGTNNLWIFSPNFCGKIYTFAPALRVFKKKIMTLRSFLRHAALIAVFFFLNLYLFSQTTVYQKDKWGAKLYYVDETNTMRIKDKWGDKLYYFDGKTIRLKDKWGQALAYMDGNTVRLRDQWGDKLYYFDGNTIRQKDQWGEKLYYLDGNVLKIKDKWGAPIFYFDGIPERWMIVCVI